MEKNNEKMKNKIVQTYAEDMAKVIESSEGGLIKKIIHGEEEHQIEKMNLSPESKKNKLFMLLGFIFILAALATLSYFYFRKTTNAVPMATQFTPLIFNDKSAFLEVKGFKKDEITQTVLNEINTTQVQNGGVEGIYLTEDKKVIGLREFIALLKSSFTPDNNPILVNDNFLTGVVNGETKDFFVLLKVRSTADIFDSMRAWESKMFFDLHGFFAVDITSDTNYLLDKSFEDGIIENKNARILYDKDGKIVMMYIFADDTSVVITNTENAAHEIMLRLAASQIKK